jgi:hypothetical protein
VANRKRGFEWKTRGEQGNATRRKPDGKRAAQASRAAMAASMSIKPPHVRRAWSEEQPPEWYEACRAAFVEAMRLHHPEKECW